MNSPVELPVMEGKVVWYINNQQRIKCFVVDHGLRAVSVYFCGRGETHIQIFCKTQAEVDYVVEKILPLVRSQSRET